MEFSLYLRFSVLFSKHCSLSLRLAYHYTILPLRYVFVASDVGNLQDPEEVLMRWKAANTDLKYWIQNASGFVHRHGHKYGTVNSVEDAHHAFVNSMYTDLVYYTFAFRNPHQFFVPYRSGQRAFITTCTEFLKSKGLQWIIYIDSDEFFVMNRVTVEEHSNITTGNTEKIELRKLLPDVRSNATVLETISKLENTQNLGNCLSLPRVLVGALENFTCPGTPSRESIESRGISYDWMSSLRFHQHSEKGDFAMSKYGKVMMKVSELTDDIMAKVPSSIHRPYKEECPRAFTLFPDALFYLNHYIGSWERYNSREDGRRSRNEWEKRAYMTAGTSCKSKVFQWFYRFEDLVGTERAVYLLGGNIERTG